MFLWKLFFFLHFHFIIHFLILGCFCALVCQQDNMIQQNNCMYTMSVFVWDLTCCDDLFISKNNATFAFPLYLHGPHLTTHLTRPLWVGPRPRQTNSFGKVWKLDSLEITSEYLWEVVPGCRFRRREGGVGGVVSLGSDGGEGGWMQIGKIETFYINCLLMCFFRFFSISTFFISYFHLFPPTYSEIVSRPNLRCIIILSEFTAP